MDQGDALAGGDLGKKGGVAPDREGRFAGEREGDVMPAGRLDRRDQPPAGRGDEGDAAGLGDRRRHLQRAPLHPAGIERRQHLEDHRAGGERRKWLGGHHPGR